MLALLAATFVATHWIDGRDWQFVRLGRDSARPWMFALGIIVGAIAIGVPSLLLLAGHELRLVSAPPGSWLASAGWGVLVFLPAALTEELLLRGYIFAVLRESAGWRWAVIGTSIAFGLLHLGNPGVDAQSVLLVIIAGFFLSTILIVTESLYAAWMVHFAWNATMAEGLHSAVSGLQLPEPTYATVSSGPAWLTGGAWGPEGGVAAGLAMFAIMFYLYARHMSRLRLER